METREGGSVANRLDSRRVAWRLSRGMMDDHGSKKRDWERVQGLPCRQLYYGTLYICSVFVAVSVCLPLSFSARLIINLSVLPQCAVCVFVFSHGSRTILQIFLNVNADVMDLEGVGSNMQDARMGSVNTGSAI